jgi:hypothetical protein
MKKILALVLVLSLVLGTFSFAFADGHLPEDVVGEDYQEEVETLMALGVVNGYPDGTFKPERTVTRAEMAKLLVEALGYGELAEGATATFPDVQGTWAESYVGFAASMDLVLGYPDGTFKPSQPMTMDEAMTMVIRALGYTDEVLKGSWPTNYKVKALDLGLTANVTSLSGEAARANVAVLLFNALDARTVEVIKDANGLFTYEYEENNDGTDKTLIDKLGKKVPEAEITIENVYGDDALDTVIDMTPYVFQTITYYENGDGEIAYVSDVHTDSLTGTLTAYNGDNLVVGDDDDEFAVTTNTALFYNGAEAKTTDANNLETDGSVELTVVYNDDNEAVGVVAWDFDIKTNVNYSERTPFAISRGSSKDLPVMENDDDEEVLDEENLVIEGAVDALEDIDSEDLVYYYAADDESDGYPAYVKVLVVRDSFQGKFTKRDSDDLAGVFGGTSFDLSDFAAVADLSGADLGSTYDLTLDKDGDIYDYELVDEDEVVEGYAIYVDEADGTLTQDDFTLDLSVDKAPRVKLFTTGGDVVVYNLDTDDLTPTDGEITTVGAFTLTVKDSTDKIELSGASFAIGNLVEFDLNSDGAITDIKLVADVKNGEFDATDMLVGDFDVTDSTVIFNIDEPASDEDVWEVLDAEDLVDGDSYDYVVGDNFNADVLVAKGDLVEADATYAVVTEYADALDEDDDEVFELTVIANGESTTYLTTTDVLEGDIVVADADDSYVDEIVTLDFSSGKVDAINTTTTVAITIDEMSGDRIKADNGDIYTLDDDVAVFIIEDDDYSAGLASDLLEGDKLQVVADSDDNILAIILDLDNQ